MSLRQINGFSKLALESRSRDLSQQGTVTRMAYHAEGKDFKAFLEELSHGAE